MTRCVVMGVLLLSFIYGAAAEAMSIRTSRRPLAWSVDGSKLLAVEVQDGPEGGVADQLRRGDAGHARTGSASVVGGVGTSSSVARTTSSGRTRRAHSSGRSERRWASAGTATAFTSSGST